MDDVLAQLAWYMQGAKSGQLDAVKGDLRR